MKGFMPSRGMLLFEIVAVLAVGALSFAAYQSVPAGSETFGSMKIGAVSKRKHDISTGRVRDARARVVSSF